MMLKCRLICQNFIRTVLRASAFISQANTNKEVTKCHNKDFKVGVCSMQGWRSTMEDSHVHLLETPQDKQAAYFAVFDGHGGASVADYAGQRLHDCIIGNECYLKKDFHGAIKSGFLKLDEELKQNPKSFSIGSTAVVVLVKDGKLFCGNAGDSRAVVCEQGKAIPLSFDHKPNDIDEMKRIFAAGGWVSARRVNGILALSRALGDFVFKNNEWLPPEHQIVTANPDIVEVELTNDHEFILLACDGIWDVVTNEEAVDFCRKRLADKLSPEQVCKELVDYCLAPNYNIRGIGTDNMTVVLVCLVRGLSDDDYTKLLKRESLSIESTTQQGQKHDPNLNCSASNRSINVYMGQAIEINAQINAESSANSAQQIEESDKNLLYIV